MNWRVVLILTITLASRYAYSQVTEDFNHGSEAIAEANCWYFYDADVSSDDHLNTGSDAPHAHANPGAVGIIIANSPSVTSPFYYFDGSITLSFTHKLTEVFSLFGSERTRVYLVDPQGNETQIFQKNGWFSKQTENLNISQVGHYRIRWRWQLTGLLALGEACLDDVSVSAEILSSIQEYDTVCEDKQNVLYEPSYSNPSNNYSYTWSFTGASGGSVTTALLTNNDRRAQVDWNNGPGDYQLLVDEFYNGVCTGRSTYFNVHVIPKPDIVAVIDTVCENKNTAVTLNFVGSAPWELKYKIDGGATQTLTTSTNPYTLTLPLNATTFDMINLKDAGECNVTATGLPTLSAYYFPLPVTGLIYH